MDRFSGRAESRKAFFFAKKKQKTFDFAVADLSSGRATADQKFFGSFLQKRTASFAVAAIAACATPTARAETPALVSRAIPSERADFDVYLPPRDPAALERLVAEQARPGSAVYHRWLSPSAFAHAYGPSAASLALARQALAAAGFTRVTQGPQSLHVAASAADVQAAFGVRLDHGRFSDGTQALVASRALLLPDALARLGARVPQFTTALSYHLPVWRRPFSAAGATGPYYPADLRQAYDFPDVTKLDASGVTVGVLIAKGYSAADMATFFANDGLPASLTPHITSIPINGGAAFDNSNTNTNSTETELDIQQSAGMAPGVAVVQYNLPDLTNANVLAGLSEIVAANQADIINMSFGGPESGYLANLNGGVDLTYLLQLQHWLFLQGNAQGITFVASSGDFGADPVVTTCTPKCASAPTLVTQEPADDPNVTAVGGTNLVTAYTKGSPSSAYVRENAMPDKLIGTNAGNWGSGGGLSRFWSKPDYQALVPTPSTTVRAVPDVAMHMGGCPSKISVTPCGVDRSSDYIQFNGALTGAIGTSAASPDFCGLLALKVKLTGGRLGNENPDIYARAKAQIAAKTDGTPYRHSKIAGSNGGYTVVAPYDLVIGNGSVDARQFLGATSLPASGNPGTAGNP
jgi:subtilase family serine protease